MTLCTFFPAKGDEDLDHTEILRSPSDTRPLGLNNTDNKTIAACTNRPLKVPIRDGANKLQNGFIAGRNFLDNIVKLDAAARVYSMNPDSLLPVLALFDFGAAFPSVVHQWLVLVFRSVKLPEGALNVGLAKYWMVMAFGRANHVVTFLFMIWSGVLQGCPLSGSFFVLAIDPFLQAFEKSIVQPGKGVIGACADDIGAALASIDSLTDLSRIFDAARSVAGLSLKASKCVIIPVCGFFTNDLSNAVRAWLISHLPDWGEFKVSAAGKYLGASVGPAAGRTLWTNAANKWASRAHLIGSSALPLQVSVMLYNSRAITTIGYIAQLALLPDKLIRQEGYVLAKLLHLPPNTFKAADFFNISNWGFKHIRSLLAFAASSMMRTALETVTVWQACLPWLESSAADFLPGERWNQGLWWPSWWDSTAFATQLSVASRGLPNYVKLKGAGARAIQALSAARRKSSEPVKTQKFLYEFLVADLYPDTLPDTFKSRLKVLSPPAELGLLRFIDFGEARRLLAKQPAPVAISILKTWAHGWTTSSRMHEAEVLPCFLGCPGAFDTQEHYMTCDRFWRLIRGSRASGSSRATRSVLGRLGLLPLSSDARDDLVVASRFYHYVKLNGNWSYFHSLVQIGDIRTLATALKRCVQAARFSTRH
jgi:hypothetical protein